MILDMRRISRGPRQTDMRVGKIRCTCLALLVSGCILPIPHKRVSVVGCEEIVCDADTGTPIMGASVSVMYSEK